MYRYNLYKQAAQKQDDSQDRSSLYGLGASGLGAAGAGGAYYAHKKGKEKRSVLEGKRKGLDSYKALTAQGVEALEQDLSSAKNSLNDYNGKEVTQKIRRFYDKVFRGGKTHKKIKSNVESLQADLGAKRDRMSDLENNLSGIGGEIDKQNKYLKRLKIGGGASAALGLGGLGYAGYHSDRVRGNVEDNADLYEMGIGAAGLGGTGYGIHRHLKSEDSKRAASLKNMHGKITDSELSKRLLRDRLGLGAAGLASAGALGYGAYQRYHDK